MLGELCKQIFFNFVFQNEIGGFIGEEEYCWILWQNWLLVEDFECWQCEGFVEGKFFLIFVDMIWVFDIDLEQSVCDEVECVKVCYVLFEGLMFVDQVEVSDVDIVIYFEENQSDYELLE